MKTRAKKIIALAAIITMNSSAILFSSDNNQGVPLLTPDQISRWAFAHRSPFVVFYSVEREITPSSQKETNQNSTNAQRGLPRTTTKQSSKK